MAPYIYTKRNGVYIIDLMKTVEQLKSVSNILKNLSAQGKKFLFVGTKRQASENIARVAFECNSFYVNQRWLGGMLTNWKTIKKSLHTLQSFTEDSSNERFKKITKKEVTQFKKRKDRLEKYLGGLKGMTSLPDVVIIVGQSEEMNAVLEAQKLGIPTISVLDTDCNPTLSDFFVVANDDSIKSLEFILNIFLQAILEGKEHQKSLN
uniref:ribosomal protein S2 n=1 Tax=Polulichloris maxima TaxID=2704661 RepID=UPI002410F6C7|nr:ribosomal protein S2 [Polulichloris maxima]WDY13214.1 ribosomal protein S2 [Polulichloris maxima]